MRRWRSRITRDSSGLRELENAARPRGVVVYSREVESHSSKCWWQSHRSESCAAFTTWSNGCVAFKRVHLTYRCTSAALCTAPPATTSSRARIIPFLSSAKHDCSGLQSCLMIPSIRFASSGLHIKIWQVHQATKSHQ